MGSEEFVDNLIESLHELFQRYTEGNKGPTSLGGELDSIGLTNEQREKVLSLIKLAVGESAHLVVSGIEGVVPLGKSKQRYKLYDEANNELTGQLTDLLFTKLEETTTNRTL